MRILHVISGDLWAGAEVATFHLLVALLRRGVDVRCVVLNEGTLAERLQNAGVAVTLLDESKLGPVEILRGLRASAASAELVHSHRYKENALASFCGRPRVITQHGRREPFRGKSRLRSGLADFVGGMAIRRAEAVIAVSEEVEVELASPRKGKRLEVIWNGLPDPQPEISAASWGQRPRQVGVLARLVPVKALELAIQGVAGCPGLELEIVGDGPERERLQATARASGGAERIRFVGHDPSPLARVANWRALLMTSLHEGNPLSVIEALSLGTPIVHTPLAGVREMSGEAGFEIPNRDPADWSARLADFVEDERRGESLSAAARTRFLDVLGDDACAEATLALYRSVLDGTTRPASR
ncbi:MAG: glycosyltransferase [Myxococcota bacterium]